MRTQKLIKFTRLCMCRALNCEEQAINDTTIYKKKNVCIASFKFSTAVYLRIPWNISPRHMLFGPTRFEITTLPRNVWDQIRSKEASYPKITKSPTWKLFHTPLNGPLSALLTCKNLRSTYSLCVYTFLVLFFSCVLLIKGEVEYIYYGTLLSGHGQSKCYCDTRTAQLKERW
jgi:hypothetical protein